MYSDRRLTAARPSAAESRHGFATRVALRDLSRCDTLVGPLLGSQPRVPITSSAFTFYHMAQEWI